MLLILSISAVSAETIDQTTHSLNANYDNLNSINDNSDTTDESFNAIENDLKTSDENIDDSTNLESSNSNILSEGESKSFSDLLNDINAGPQEGLDIKSDYKFNNLTDTGFEDGIRLNIAKDGVYTIEGNNHFIDANKQVGIFKFTGGTVYINNLKFINANKSPIILQNCRLYTNNVTFENNTDSSEGAAVYSSGSNYASTNDKFINNYAKNGAAIYGYDSIIDINNSTFINDNNITWSLIYAYSSITKVNNTVFANLTSKYATAIYSEGNDLIVSNSQFINLYAENTAGAIGVKKTNVVSIDNCSFINVTSSKNGGAVYGDLNGNKYNGSNIVTIKSSMFENCSSNFGGACLLLGGNSNIVQSNFTNNKAECCGGAIYFSNTTALIGNNNFNNNNATYFYGGAIYIDDSDSIVTASDFKNNYAGTIGGGIYLYDSLYTIKNSNFSKNGNETVVSFFDRKKSGFINNQLSDGKVNLNQEEYTVVVDYKGKEIILRTEPVTITENASSSRFDLRDYGLAGVVKDQGNNGACWAFGATGALESAFLKATGIQLNLSENNIQNSALHYGTYGTPSIFEGGYSTSGMGLFLAWLGTLSVDYDSYDELGKITLTAFSDDSYHIQDCVIIPKRQNALDNSKLKEALTKYGGVTVHLYGAISNNNYYNPQTHSQYYDGTEPGNHFVTLVGWDDNYSKDNFLIKPKGDGAWICKNSWGTDWGENGYFYVSYYDTTFAMYATSVAYIINNTESYVRLYQYDIGDIDRYFNNPKGQYLSYINRYVANDNELISAIGTYFEKANENYTITVYVEGQAVYSQSGVSAHGGFSTIKLNKQIAVNYGQEFSVEIKSKGVPLRGDCRMHFKKGNSIVIHPNNESEDLAPSGLTACIKAYTFTNPNPEKSKSYYYNKNSTLTIDSNANGKTLRILKDNKVLGSAVVSDGKAVFDLILDPGSYSLITSYDDRDVVEGFEVMDTIEVIESKTAGYNSLIEINAKFYDDEGIELFYREITLKLDNKTYKKVIDNNKGILTLKLSGLSIGTHTLILENPETLEETVTTIKVVSRFSGNSNVNMYYGDGSRFKARIYGDDGKPVGAGKVVTLKFNKRTYYLKTNSYGYITFKIPNTAKPGKYTISAKYKGQTIKNTVKVKQVLKLSKVTIKKSAKKLVLTASLKKGKTPIKNKKVTFRFNGKKYSAKTNKKGIAKITIKRSVLKKLKAGKKVTYKVTYLKDTVKRRAKVRR